MKTQLKVRVAAVLFMLALMASAAIAANVAVSPDQGEYIGWCDSACHGSIAPFLDDRPDRQIQPAPGLCLAACGSYGDE